MVAPMGQIKDNNPTIWFEIVRETTKNLPKIHVVQDIRKNDRIRTLRFLVDFRVYLKECADPKYSFSETQRPKLSHLLRVKPDSQIVQRSNVISGYIDTDSLPCRFCF